jgi:hypothetical protein
MIDEMTKKFYYINSCRELTMWNTSTSVAPQWSLTGYHLPRSAMPTIGDTRHDILVKKARRLINEWLQTQIDTPHDTVFVDGANGRRYAGWDIPGISLADDSITVLENGMLAVTLVMTRRAIFSGAVKSQREVQCRRDVSDPVFHDQILGGIVMALESSLGKVKP